MKGWFRWRFQGKGYVKLNDWHSIFKTHVANWMSN